MALQSCRECGERVSSEAPTCPHCGATDPAGTGARAGARALPTAPEKRKTGCAAWGCLGVIVIGAVGAIVGAINDPPAVAADRNNASNASGACHSFVEGRLKAPRSAKFDVSAMGAEPVDSLTWNAWGAVDAQNSFGAMIRSQYTCRVRYDRARDEWVSLSVHIDE